MSNNRIGYDQPGQPGRGEGLFTRLVALTVGIIVLSVMLVVGLAFSLVVIPIVLLALIVGGGYLWFKTRTLRRELREQMQAYRESMPGNRPDADMPGHREGGVIEGDFIREAEVTEVNRERKS